MSRVWIAGVYADEKGMFSGHIEFHNDLIKAIAKGWNTDEKEVWNMIADMLHELEEQIREAVRE